MLCSKCKKNRAVVFVKKLENGKQYDEGYCLSCAKELGIAPIDDMMQKMGLNAENMEDIEGQIAEMMDMFESGDMPEDFSPFGGMGMFPMGGDFPKNDGTDAKSKDKKSKKKSLLDTYGINLNNKAKKGEIDRVIGRDKELYRVIQILNRRTKNNPALIGEPGVGKTAIAESLALKIIEKKVPANCLIKKFIFWTLLRLLQEHNSVVSLKLELKALLQR